MMSVCGINCSSCPCFKATTGFDTATLETTAKEWSSDATKFKVADMVCLGCGPKNKAVVFSGAQGCSVRLCAIAKNVELCALCNEFAGCEKIHKMLAGRDQKCKDVFAMINQKACAACSQAAATKS